MKGKKQDVLLNSVPVTIEESRPFGEDVSGIILEISNNEAERVPELVNKLRDFFPVYSFYKDSEHFFSTISKSIEELIADLRADGFEITETISTTS